MRAYAVRARMPKNTRIYFDYVKREVLKRCEELNADCVLEMLDGRIVIFTDAEDVNRLFEGIRGFISSYSVDIFEEFEELVREIMGKLENCKSFAIRSNRKALEKELGARIVENMNIEVNLENPDCEIYVEKRGKVYLLFSHYP